MDGHSLARKFESIQLAKQTPFGKPMLKHFFFDPEYKNLNHGSFGAFPRVVREKQRELQDECETRPDLFIRYKLPKLLDAARESVAKILSVPASTVVLVPNATTGVNTVLRNIKWNANGKDEIINFNIIYGSCGKTIAFISENTELVSAREITITFPASNAVIVDAFKAAIRASRAAGKNPRMAIFDTVSSMPGLRLPFEELTSVCAAEGVLSLIDGAHGIGHIPLNLTTVNPDFFVSNTHKWLFVPRGSAILYVPERNQHLIRSTLPTSHGFIPVGSERDLGPLPPSTKSNFISQFNSYGTIDNANYLCIPTAVKFREEVCGGEAAITSYCISLAKEGGARVAAIMGTQVLDNEDHTLTDCALVNVELPISFGAGPGAYQNIVPVEHKSKVHEWILKTLLSDYHTFIAIVFFQGRFWARLSAQVYLDLADFEWAGRTLKDVSERAGKGEYLETTN